VKHGTLHPESMSVWLALEKLTCKCSARCKCDDGLLVKVKR
jgi:hypothetical protein